MDPNKKIVDLTTEELADLGYLTDKVAPDIKKRVERVLASPEHLGQVTVFMVECSIRHNARQAAAPQVAADPPASSTSSVNGADTLFSRYSGNSPAFTVVAPDLISKPGDRYFSIPVKTVHDIIGTPLHAVWPTVAPAILASLKSRGIRYSAVQPVRFSIVEGDGDKRLGPVVVWIAIPPNSAKASAVRDATPDILHILAEAQITGVVVEWFLGTITKLVDLA